AFLPVSQLSSEHYPRVEGGDQGKILEKLRDFINHKINIQVITAEPKEEKLIISEKKAEFEKQKEKMGDLKIGDVIDGEISGVVDFGAFVKFNGLEGLIHISELAWQRIESPSDIVHVTEKVKAKVIGIDDTKITLSLKRLKEDPWLKNAKKYKVGDVIGGKVNKVTPYGAFIQLDKDIHGLVHISEISSKKVDDIKNFLKVGSEKDFKILSIEPKEHRLGLSLKAVTEKDSKKESDKKEKGKEKKDSTDKKKDSKDKKEDKDSKEEETSKE
ncbi:S1 RNA-binding domain-containing protein, partial [Patescibacteria group bacterium]|nr:S1 RNA-binding domain-containing protein [Patescibacteria group bacterium]